MLVRWLGRAVEQRLCECGGSCLSSDLVSEKTEQQDADTKK